MTVLIDNSTMEGLASCHTKVAMERILHLKPLAGNFFIEAGSAMHKAWEKFFTGHPVQDCIQALRDYYGPLLPTFENLPVSHSLENLEMIFGIWADRYKDRVFAWTPQYVERSFQVRLHPDLDVELTGKMDTFGADGEGSLCVVDWKTTGRLDNQWLRKWKASSQVSAYLYAMGRIFGPSVWVMYVMGLEIKKIPMTTRRCNEHGMKYWDPEKQEGCYYHHVKNINEPCYRDRQKILEWWMDTKLLSMDYINMLQSVKTIEDIQKIPQQGMFNGSCYNCDYHDFCHVFKRKPEAAEQMFQVKPWSPMDGMSEEQIFREKQNSN